MRRRKIPSARQAFQGILLFIWEFSDNFYACRAAMHRYFFHILSSGSIRRREEKSRNFGILIKGVKSITRPSYVLEVCNIHDRGERNGKSRIMIPHAACRIMLWYRGEKESRKKEEKWGFFHFGSRKLLCIHFDSLACVFFWALWFLRASLFVSRFCTFLFADRARKLNVVG